MRRVTSTIRRPEYTGERRCWSCTALNALLLLVSCIVVASLKPAFAILLGIAGTGLLWLRGYVVPYTPTVAPRLVAVLPFDVPFEGSADAHDRPPDGSERGSLADVGSDRETGELVLAALVDAEVLETDEEGYVYLSDPFRARWRREMESLRNLGADELATAIEEVVDDPGYDVETLEPAGRTWFVLSDGSDDPTGETWFSRPAVIAELAAVRTLKERAPDLPPDLRSAASRPLRGFLEECPACGGGVVETSSAACCGGHRNPRDEPDEVLACRSCDRRLYTFPDEPGEGAPG